MNDRVAAEASASPTSLHITTPNASASNASQEGSVYLMDEPTCICRHRDVLAIIDRMVDSGNTVVVIEHNLAIIKSADWNIDMGPEGWSKGGRVMFERTPENLVGCAESLTSGYLD